MNIANPIYDVVFKYLMDDKKIAKRLLSLIIGENIIDLNFQPTEIRSHNAKQTLTVLHMDFAATIELEGGGYKKIIIELQKAKLYSDIMRFRRYLASQYSDANNRDENNRPLPIVSIYFLGYPLDNVKASVVKVKRNYYDVVTGNIIDGIKEEFIEALTHDSFIIQIPYLKESRQNLLTDVLSVFRPIKKHFINISEDEYPKEYNDVIKRLIKAGAEPSLREDMDVEDEYFEELGEMERELHLRQLALEQKDQVLEQKDQALEQKDQAINTAVKLLSEQMNISLGEAKKILGV